MNKSMENKAKELLLSAKNAQERISKLTSEEKTNLEKEWDIEHAYYSSSLEGSKIDRKEFEKMAEKVK